MIRADLGPGVLPASLEALAWTLVHFLWQGVAVAATLALTDLLLRRAAAQTRYALACLALATMALLPVATFILLYARLESAVPDDPALVLALLAEGAPLTRGSALPWLLAVWASGALAMSIRLAGGWGYIRYAVRRYGVPLETRWHVAAGRLARQMGVHRGLRLLGSARVRSPMLVGWWRPTIVLPLALITSLPSDYVEALLAHEIAHVRRHDQLVNLLQSAVEALLFYHPAVWWVSCRIRIEREYCCDDLALEHVSDPLAYARALTAVADAGAPPELASAAQGGSLMSRIKRIVRMAGPEPRTEVFSNLAVLAVAAAACLGVLGLALAHDAERGISIAWLPHSIQKLAPEVQTAAAAHGVEPELLAIMALVESGGQPDARSPIGAMGLMQVMPSTARRIAEARGIDDFEIEDLLDPATSLDFGAWYLARQMEAFPADDAERALGLAVAAYNAGPKRLRAHLVEGATLSEETRRYRALILSLWKDRDDESSPAFEAYVERLKERSRPDA